MPRPYPCDWRTLRVDGFRRRRPLAREQTQAASTLRASVQFAAALCEISGRFLIFTLAPFTSGTTLNGLRFTRGSVASTPPQPLRGHGSHQIEHCL
jgi:hypothetical protein